MPKLDKEAREAIAWLEATFEQTWRLCGTIDRRILVTYNGDDLGAEVLYVRCVDHLYWGNRSRLDERRNPGAMWCIK